MDEIISSITSAQRVAFLTLDVFAFLALALAAVGIYGVTSYAVGQRIHEIGVRVALGAQRSDILRLVIFHGMRLVSVGVLIGLFASLPLTRLMTGLLFGVSATDRSLSPPLLFCSFALLFWPVTFPHTAPHVSIPWSLSDTNSLPFESFMVRQCQLRSKVDPE